MTNNEHNEKVLAKIVEHQEAIEALKETLKPADAVAEVSLEQCNAGAREVHFAKYAEQDKLKLAVEAVMALASKEQDAAPVEPVTDGDVAEINEPEPEPKAKVKKAEKDE